MYASEMLPRHLTLEKNVGETPLQVLERARTLHHIPTDVALAYAGRLDPMASGKLLILIGDECKVQEQYHSFDKEYEFEVLFEIATDSGDILGLPTYTPHIGSLRELDIKETARTLENTEITLKYPVFSSKTVKGKPLFMWALEDKLDHIEIPTATTKLFKLTYHHSRQFPPDKIRKYVHERINLVPRVTEESKLLGADFRRVKTLKAWDEVLRTTDASTFLVARFTCICSSGTYIRSLAPHIASLLGTTGLAFSIHRTKIGKYFPLPIFKRHGVWFKQF